nr:MAG TPA: hypothetical protein [Caudoviricetes sp.]
MDLQRRYYNLEDKSINLIIIQRGSCWETLKPIKTAFRKCSVHISYWTRCGLHD